jgi:hypothetical protein
MSTTTLTANEDVARLLLEGTTPVARDVAEALDHTTDWHGCRDRLIVLCRLADALQAGERELDVGECTALLASICERHMLPTLQQALADLQGEDQRRAAYERDLRTLSAFNDALRRTAARLTVTVPAKVFALLRQALLVELAVTCERTTEITKESAVTRAGWAGPLERLDRLRGALDQIGWEQAPVKDTEMLISSIMAETLERELEHHEHRASRPDESKADRIVAAANADSIARFLAGLGGE